MKDKFSRRSFVKFGGLLGLTSLLTPPLAAETRETEDITLDSPEIQSNIKSFYVFFNEREERFIEAAIDRLIPSDAVGPGALELGVAFYIDKQLDDAYGNGERMYLEGPFAAGEKTQGYQLPLRPKEVYRVGIALIDAYCQANYANKSFYQLKASEQDDVLGKLETGKIEIEGVPATVFFALLWQNTREGYFGDPVHGGNKQMGSWKMLGFPGARADFRDDVGKSERLTYEPVSLVQIINTEENLRLG